MNPAGVEETVICQACLAVRLPVDELVFVHACVSEYLRTQAVYIHG